MILLSEQEVFTGELQQQPKEENTGTRVQSYSSTTINTGEVSMDSNPFMN